MRQQRVQRPQWAIAESRALPISSTPSFWCMARGTGAGAGAPASSAQCLRCDQAFGRGLAAAAFEAYASPDLYRNLYVQELRERWLAAHLYRCDQASLCCLVPTHNRIREDPTWSFTTIEAGHDAVMTAPFRSTSLHRAHQGVAAQRRWRSRCCAPHSACRPGSGWRSAGCRVRF